MSSSTPSSFFPLLTQFFPKSSHHFSKAVNDVLSFLTTYPTFLPHTLPYPYDVSPSATLLQLQGNLSLSYSGSLYTIPLIIWLHPTYPLDPPIVHVTPSHTLTNNSCRFITVNGKIDHPYLTQWSVTSCLLELLDHLSKAFTLDSPFLPKHEPLYPPETLSMSENITPKPNVVSIPPSNSLSSISLQPPAKPPKPPQLIAEQQAYFSLSGLNQYTSLPLTQPSLQYTLPKPSLNDSSKSEITDSASSALNPKSTIPPPLPSPVNLRQSLPKQQSFAKPFPIDLLSSPINSSLENDLNKLTISRTIGKPCGELSYTQSPSPPLNPEREAVLNSLSALLIPHIHKTQHARLLLYQSLQSHYTLLQSLHQSMIREIEQLNTLMSTIQKNKQTIHDALIKADALIAQAKSRQPPSIDELFVAPNIVSQQLYNLCAEDSALTETRAALARAFDAGRVTFDAFIKQTRNLAREQFFTKALIMKVSEHIGLKDCV